MHSKSKNMCIPGASRKLLTDSADAGCGDDDVEQLAHSLQRDAVEPIVGLDEQGMAVGLVPNA